MRLELRGASVELRRDQVQLICHRCTMPVDWRLDDVGGTMGGAFVRPCALRCRVWELRIVLAKAGDDAGISFRIREYRR